MQKGSPDEGRWLKDIVKYTPRPGFIHSIADAFMEKEGFQKYWKWEYITSVGHLLFYTNMQLRTWRGARQNKTTA